MQNPSFEDVVERIVQQDARFHPDAYEFVRAALDFTQQQASPDGGSSPRHVSGQQLLDGIRAFALHEFGPMALTVLQAWGVRRCEDFGEIVFNLVDHRFLKKTDSDSREDFKAAYAFDEAFVHPFLPPSRLRKLRREPAGRNNLS